MSTQTSRRNFIKKTAIAGTAISVLPRFTFANNTNTKEKLKLGLIGVGLRGTNHLKNVLLREDVLVTAICDIDQTRIDLCLETIKASGKLVWLDDVEFISDAPGKNDGESGLGGGGISTTALIKLVKNAKSSIEIQTPYLITTELSQNLFKAAVDRGVKIRILTNSLASTDNVEAFSSYQTDRETLLKTGVRIFEFKPDAEERKRIMTGELQEKLNHEPIFGLHSKSMVIDNKVTVVGTFNLDPRSANLNTECIVVVNSEQVTKGVLEGMEIEFQPENSWETTLDFNPDSEVSNYKRLKTWTRKILPKSIL